ncbi:MAG: UDP-glucose/GDP-mannose dehydrogenase family protein [Geminicoccaceae bacterium]|nr:UDP-glucose/GDP-mannose dehydrogenase family protein [Geminicoccaceae bacterium]MDW8369216.1 UDP-glucose/GDP-mannose dehydrogenase family protein [Geminicoccaceae bacterium]
MRIAMIGTGYVGLVSGACFAEFGVEVTCVDKSSEKIAMLEQGRIPIYEPGLEDLVARHKAAGRLRFSTELAPALEGADAVFIAVGTPTRRGDGHADLSYVFSAAEEIAKLLTHPTVVVTKSTVPVGTGRRLRRLFDQLRPDLEIHVASNPEFLREGSAIEDFLRPDRVVCGVETQRAREVLAALYRPLNLIETPILFTTIETAELVKYATNSFLATKITFINEIADLCEAVGADVQQVARGIGLDGRIGRKFLHAGPGYGGSCFPKDTLALLRTGEMHGVQLRIVDTVVQVNEARKRRMVKKIVDAMGGEVAGKRIAVLGVTFKPNTDDMRESPSLVIVPALQAEGAELRVFDPEGRREGEKLLPGVVWCADAYEAMAGADATVVLTEWNVFRGLDLERARSLVRGPVLVDLRNVFDPERAIRAGFRYTGVGRGSIRPVD